MKLPLGFILIWLACLSSCVHPPPPTQKEVSPSTLPREVTETFNARFPATEIKKVVKWCFNRRVVCYYIDYSRAGSPVRTVAITPKGEVTEYEPRSTSK